MLTLAFFVLLQAGSGTGADDARLRELIGRLEDPDIEVRDAAAVELRALGDRAKAALRKALAHADGEVRARAKQLLAPPVVEEEPVGKWRGRHRPAAMAEWPKMRRPIVQEWKELEAPVVFDWPKVQQPFRMEWPKAWEVPRVLEGARVLEVQPVVPDASPLFRPALVPGKAKPKR